MYLVTFHHRCTDQFLDECCLTGKVCLNRVKLINCQIKRINIEKQLFTDVLLGSHQQHDTGPYSGPHIIDTHYKSSKQNKLTNRKIITSH